MRAPGLGAVQLIGLVEALGGIDAVVRCPGAKLRAHGLKPESIAALVAPDEARLAQDLEWLSAPGRHLVAWGSDAYPPLLQRIAAPPAALFVEGEPDALWQPQVAVVGSRNPTAGGVDHARAFSKELCRQGMAVTSGLASGIDCAAHEAAIASGGTTIAVTGTGLDTVYPASSAKLAADIPRHGALVSELPPGSPPKRSHFPARNRIISGLSLGVLVVEAGLNSGSLITARHAAEQGREVFALPGSLHNPMVKGCHRLIREGARLVETCGDILADLAPLAAHLAVELQASLARDEAPESPAETPSERAGRDILSDPEYARLWEVMGYDPQPVDHLVTRAGMPVRAVSSMLLMLELEGLVEVHAGSRYCRKARDAEGRSGPA